MRKRHLWGRLFAAAALAAMPMLSVSAAETLTLVVPFATGASADATSRLVAQQISRATGQNVIVDNRPGANGITAASFVKRAPADGRTLYLSNIGDAINASLYDSLPYNALTDFAPVSLLWRFPSVLAVPAASPARTVADLIALSRTVPNGLSYGSAGVGSSGHLLGEMLKAATKAPLVHIPYKGMAPAQTDLMANRLHFVFVSYGSIFKQVESGHLRILAIASGQRAKALPDVPTLNEAGISGNITMDSWFGVSVPAGTPEAIVRNLQKQFAEAIQTPRIASQLAEQGIEAVGNSSAEYQAIISTDTQRLGTLIKSIGAKAE